MISYAVGKSKMLALLQQKMREKPSKKSKGPTPVLYIPQKL